MSDEARKAVRLRITGRVQGVGYRLWAVREAGRRGLDGWVRNRRDGSVEALVAGPAGMVEELIGLCARGPDLARVVDIRAEPAADPGPTGFSEAPTA